jgi:predicted phage-related endonuclease
MGYVDNPARALSGEPEAVSEDEQLALTEASRQRALDERIRRREATAADIERELDHLEGRCRYLRRQLKRLQR